MAPQRDTAVIEQVVEQVRAAGRVGQTVVWATDGFMAWKSSILRVCREPVRTGKRGRPRLVVWAELHIVQVIKRCTDRRLTSIERRVTYGSQRCAEGLVWATQAEMGVFNTAYIERLNATFRTWMSHLTRRTGTPVRETAHLEGAMFWMGAVYNFCRVHATLRAPPAMAADLTDHVWSVDELVRYRLRRE